MNHVALVDRHHDGGRVVTRQKYQQTGIVCALQNAAWHGAGGGMVGAKKARMSSTCALLFCARSHLDGAPSRR